MRTVAVILVFLVLPAVALAWLPAPFLWISVGWAAFFFTRVRPNRHRRRGPIYLAVGAALIAFAGVETLFLLDESRTIQKADDGEGDKLGGAHEFLGYAPRSDAHKHVDAKYEGETIYEVDYTIGANGLRVAPPAGETPAEGSILFFGGSYTFGEGVNDDETLPYQTGVLLDGRYATYNFGFLGYGPHHMLASVEHGRVASLVREPPRYAIYLAITDHVARAARPMSWDPRGPRYVLGDGGAVNFAGQFDAARPATPTSAWDRLGLATRRELRKSYILRRLVSERPKTAADYALWIGIVGETRRRLESAYPGLEFHVVFWDSPYVNDGPQLEALDAGGFRTHRASRILTGLKDDIDPWILSPKDRHPNARAHAALAEYVVNEIVASGAR